jgi:transmembrane sensor
LQKDKLTPYESSKYEVWRANAENARALAEAQHVWQAMRVVLASRPSVPKVRARIASWQLAAAALGGVAVVATSAMLFGAWDMPTVQTPRLQVLETHAEPLKDYELLDRTLVDLRPGTRLSFEMSDAQRLAHVPQGEVFFNVAKDPLRPFVVGLDQGSIKALGTRFAVRQYDGPPLVVVQEGAVAVKRADDAAISVKAGQQLEILDSGELIVRSVDADKELAWARKLVNVSGKTIGEVAEEFNRRNKVKIQIADQRLAREVLNLDEYYLDEPEFFVDALALQGKVIVNRADAQTLRLTMGPQSGPGGR